MGKNRTLVYTSVWILGVWVKVTSQQVSAGMEQSIQTETKAPAHLSFSLLKHHLFKTSCTFPAHTPPRTCKHVPELILVLILTPSHGSWVHSVLRREPQGGSPWPTPAVPARPRSGPGQPRAPCSSHWAPSAAHLGGRNSSEGSPLGCDRTHPPNATVTISLTNIFNKREKNARPGALMQTKALLRAEAAFVRILTQPPALLLLSKGLFCHENNRFH